MVQLRRIATKKITGMRMSEIYFFILFNALITFAVALPIAVYMGNKATFFKPGIAITFNIIVAMVFCILVGIIVLNIPLGV